MKRVILLFILLCLTISSCGIPVDLGEHDGMFSKGGPVTEGAVCSHKIIYERAELHSETLADEEYHYMYCHRSLQNEVCTLRGEFEPHTKVYDRKSDEPVRLHNGSFYHIVYYACADCRHPAGYEYILCGNNEKSCDGSCGALDGIVGG